MAEFEKVVQMFGENLASWLKLWVKWLELGVNFPKLLHAFHQIRDEEIKGLSEGTYKIVKIEVSAPVVESTVKLIPQGITIISAFSGNVKNFFEGKAGVSVWRSDRFRDVILKNASKEVSCEGHRKENWKLSVNMYDSAIQAELGQTMHQTVDQYLASIMSRIKIWKDGGEHGLLTNGYSNIEYVNVGNRVVVVYCRLFGDQWGWRCRGLVENGPWDGGDQFSSLV